MATITLVGIQKGRTKNGKDFYNYFGLKEFSNYDHENSECHGQRVITEFSYTNYDIAIGDVVEFKYEPGYEGKAVLADVVLVKPGGHIPFEEKPEPAKKEDGGKK